MRSAPLVQVARAAPVRCFRRTLDNSFPKFQPRARSTFRLRLRPSDPRGRRCRKNAERKRQPHRADAPTPNALSKLPVGHPETESLFELLTRRRFGPSSEKEPDGLEVERVRSL